MKRAESVCIITLGCPKNTVESEHLAGILSESGLRLTTDLATADYALVHTCSFIADARRESESVIRQLVARKAQGKLKRIVVSGCLVQAERTRMAERFPGVDAFTGTGRLSHIGDLFKEGAPQYLPGKPGGLIETTAPRLLSSPLPVAYLRLAEGCNHRCSFCIIPRLRGEYRSRSVTSVLDEARALAASGIEELVLIAQDTSCYGYDRYGRFALSGLLRRLCGVAGVRWLRLMYAYPATVSRELLAVVRDEPKICNYLDIPLQHASDRVLKRMRRPGGVQRTVRRLKEYIPDIALRTSFIVGFPGETDRDFAELARFVEAGWFEHVGVFEYSPSGDAAAKLPGQVSGRVKKERRRMLMRLQQGVVAAHQKQRIGSITDVLVEERLRQGWRAGRAPFQAPEIDTKIIFAGAAEPGSFVKVKVTGAHGYDLTGVMI